MFGLARAISACRFPNIKWEQIIRKRSSDDRRFDGDVRFSFRPRISGQTGKYEIIYINELVLVRYDRGLDNLALIFRKINSY